MKKGLLTTVAVVLSFLTFYYLNYLHLRFAKRWRIPELFNLAVKNLSG